MTPRNKAHYLAQVRLGGLRDMLLNEQTTEAQHIANKHIHQMISYTQGLRDERADAITELEAIEAVENEPQR